MTMSSKAEAIKLASDVLGETSDKVYEIVKQEREIAGNNSGDGSEEMPYAAAAAHLFFVRYCQTVDIWTANPSNVQWATPILMLGGGWTVKSWVNAVGAKHLFIVSPRQKVYASTWAWGPVRHKIDLLEETLIQYFAPDVLTPPMPKLPQDRPPASSSKSISGKKSGGKKKK